MTTSSRRIALLSTVVVCVVAAAVGLRTRSTTPAEDGTRLGEVPAAPAATPERAARAMERLRLFREGNSGVRLSLGSDDVTALLRHSLPGVLPAGVTDPYVAFVGHRVRVEARVSTDDFVAKAPLASVLGALPDTVSVDVVGTLVSVHGTLRFEVEEAHAGPVRLPAAVVAAIADELSTASGTRMAASGGTPTVTLRQPSGFATLEVVDDRLVLRRDERMVDRAVDGSDHP